MKKPNKATDPDATTTWTNDHPTATATFVLNIRNGFENQPAIKRTYTIPPKGSKDILSIFDEAIQVTDESGVVVGGKAPWLTKNGKKPILSKALDWVALEEEETINREVERLQREELKAKARASLEEKKKLKG